MWCTPKKNDLKIFDNWSFQVFSCVNNPVKYIHPDSYRGLSALQRLKLRSAHLHQLPSFQHIGHSLTDFELSFSVQFIGNNAHDFSYLWKIKDLNMVHNGLKSTPLGLNHVANTVKILDFSSNAIHSIASMEGIKFVKLQTLYLSKNKIAHLRPEFLIAPRLQSLNLERNILVSLDDVTQYPWGSSLPGHKYMIIHMRWNPWHCNGSFIWMRSNLYRYYKQIVYAKPPFKPCITNVDQLFCTSPDERIDTYIVPKYVIRSVNVSIRSLGDLAGKSLQWRHNGRDGVSNHQPHHCLLNRSFRRRSKKTSKLRVTGLCAENSPVTGEFPAQMSSDAENISIWWRHHVLSALRIKCIVKSYVWKING